MSAEHEISDSPVGWVAKHARRYVESGGTRGQRWSGLNTLLITTRGRRTGKLRRTPLIYGQDGDRYIVVGSNGGKSAHPSWFLNLLETPTVDVQVGTEQFSAHARPASSEERPALWELMTSIFSEYERFQQRTSRELPVVILEPDGSPAA